MRKPVYLESSYSADGGNAALVNWDGAMPLASSGLSTAGLQLDMRHW